MSRPDATFTREQIMAAVWDENYWGSTRTLDTHISTLRRKIGDDTDPPTADRHRAGRRIPLRGLADDAGSFVRRRLVISTIAIVLVVLGTLAVPVGLIVYDAAEQQLDARLQEQATHDRQHHLYRRERGARAELRPSRRPTSDPPTESGHQQGR